MQLVAVFIGGGLGSLCRFLLSKWMLNQFTGNLPVGTILSNVLACTIMGVVLYFYKGKVDAQWIRPLVLIGFCGGFSTFSTFSLETVYLMKQQLFGFAAINVVLSVASCLILLWFLTQKVTL